ncbi:MAG TPA: hypothetical protein VLD19_17660, partial [Chitinophagaceae bacterium]|nr:hypothetical protein [Chitinophagaceae bacterium]
MKKITHLSFLLLCAGTGVLAQTPVFNNNINKLKPLPPGVLQNLPQLTLNGGMTRYDPNARVKYIFNDGIRMNEVTGRLPQAGDYITLGAVVQGKEYTLVPPDLAIDRSTAGVQNMRMVQTATPTNLAAGVPRAQTIWKVSRSGAGFALSYNGAFAGMNPDIQSTGGWLGTQAGQVKIAG